MARTTAPKTPRTDALEQLEYEDRALMQILEDFDCAEERLDHGRAGKRSRLLVRLHATYDWLRGFPTGGPVPSSEVEPPDPAELPGHEPPL